MSVQVDLLSVRPVRLSVWRIDKDVFCALLSFSLFLSLPHIHTHFYQKLFLFSSQVELKYEKKPSQIPALSPCLFPSGDRRNKKVGRKVEGYIVA